MVSAAWRLPAQHTPSQETTRVLIILDCSQSMWDKWQSDSKIKVTQQVLLPFMDSIAAHTDIQVALRVFGHLNKDGIPTQLEVPFAADNLYQLKSKIKTLVPNGECSATTALEHALKDFPRDDNARNIVVLITAETHSSDGDLCSAISQLQQSGAISQTFILAFGTPDNSTDQSECAGQFTLIPDEERFDETLHQIFFLSDQDALLTLALVDNSHHLYETEIPVFFFDHNTHALRYSTVYHYNTQQPADTLTINPLLTYDITVATKPSIKLNNRHFKPGTHNRLEIPAPQGSLRLHLENRRTSFQLPQYNILVRRHNDPELLSTQSLGDKKNYLSGSYDIDILSLPVLHLSNIKIQSNSDTDLQIPLPGQLALTKPQGPTAGSIFVFQPDGIEWVCNLDPTNSTERIILMPGDYQVILQPVNDNSNSSVQTARFTIRSAQQTGVTIK